MTNENETCLFKWHVLVLDDFTRPEPKDADSAMVDTSIPHDPEIVNALVATVTLWAYVQALGDKIEDLPAQLVSGFRDNPNECPLFPWDLILVDMEWRTLRDPCPSNSIALFLKRDHPDWNDSRLEAETALARDQIVRVKLSSLDPCLLRPPNSKNDAKGSGDRQKKAIGEWLDCLSLASIALPEQVGKDCKWLQSCLKPQEVGPWIAAMMSHFCPRAELLLYSQSADEVKRRPSVAPWVNFSPARRPLDVAQKSATRGIRPEELVRKIEFRQREVLRSNPPLAEWSQRQWMRFILHDDTLLADDRDSAVITRLRKDGNSERVKVLAKHFFPQVLFAANDATCRSVMEQSMRQVVSGVCRRSIFQWDFQSRVESALHTLGHVAARDGCTLDDLEDAVRCVGVECLPALAVLSEAREAGSIPFSESLTSGNIEKAYPVLERVLHFLFTLEDGYSYMHKTVNSTTMQPIQEYVLSRKTRGSLGCGFPMIQADWDTLRGHLGDNCKSVCITKTANDCISVFAVAQESHTRNSLCDAILSACRTRGALGIRRGQPAVVLTALQMGATAIRYHLSGEVWDVLSGMASFSSGTSRDCGVEIIFPVVSW